MTFVLLRLWNRMNGQAQSMGIQIVVLVFLAIIALLMYILRGVARAQTAEPKHDRCPPVRSGKPWGYPHGMGI